MSVGDHAKGLSNRSFFNGSYPLHGARTAPKMPCRDASWIVRSVRFGRSRAHFRDAGMGTAEVRRPPVACLRISIWRMVVIIKSRIKSASYTRRCLAVPLQGVLREVGGSGPYACSRVSNLYGQHYTRPQL